MSRQHCQRMWEAEAVEDGRLAVDDQASFERHASECGACAFEWAQLKRLRGWLSSVPEPKATSLERLRLRHNLLTQVAHGSRRAGRRTILWPLVAVAAAGVVAACVLLIAPARRSAQLGASVSEQPRSQAPVARFEVMDLAGATWSTAQTGSITRVSLIKGRAAFHVYRLAPGVRFIVQLPDGEVEVHGTRFEVDLRDGHTQRVVVTEGIVALRLGGRHEQRLLAGERWEASQETTPPPEAPSGVPALAGDGPLNAGRRRVEALPSSLARSGPMPAVKPRRSTDTRPAERVSARAASSDAETASIARDEGRATDDAFADALSSFQKEDFARAERLFAAFEHAYPRDARGEDAAFLRAVARSRLGDAAGAADLAREYLQKFPSGLRRTEAARLAGQAP